MKYEFIEHFLYIDDERIPIEFDYLTYDMNEQTISGYFDESLKIKLIQSQLDCSSNMIYDFDATKYNELFYTNMNKFSFELLQDMKVLHGIDAEAEMMNAFKCIVVRIKDQELNYLFDIEHKKALVKARLLDMQQDFE